MRSREHLRIVAESGQTGAGSNWGVRIIQFTTQLLKSIADRRPRLPPTASVIRTRQRQDHAVPGSLHQLRREFRWNNLVSLADDVKHDQARPQREFEGRRISEDLTRVAMSIEPPGEVQVRAQRDESRNAMHADRNMSRNHPTAAYADHDNLSIGRNLALDHRHNTPYRVLRIATQCPDRGLTRGIGCGETKRARPSDGQGTRRLCFDKLKRDRTCGRWVFGDATTTNPRSTVALDKDEDGLGLDAQGLGKQEVTEGRRLYEMTFQPCRTNRLSPFVHQVARIRKPTAHQ